MTGFRRGVRLGIDVGKARVGVARCDPDGMLAVPVETVARGDMSITRITELAREYGAMEIVVGLPLNMRGDDTLSTTDARDFAAALGEALPDVGIRLVDERLSTVSAHSALRQSGRSQKQSRGIVDQVAAVVFLQHAVDTEKRMGAAPGEALPQRKEP
ncbi:Holliday junction resolvase RuvX [Microbacterium amylolyticum]|uniref:Putative pre-16S rRNA nuclease n=1 Tax=Microbacterium amylolyticum TaxID=936337 RepID=A0ABS4ZE24_9MICO|nr:Holliday junction resolvase RuvX [Microbacterium amylolyticum]MBP2435530.1 putative Holliday junction resolvase [Microbacterium amylolyticum]